MVRMQTAVIDPTVIALTCSDLSIRAGRRIVVDRFSWTHQLGGIAWLVGTNGSGKSSLLRVFAGWQQPARGSVRWSGLRARIGYYAPAMSAPSHLRIAEFLRFVGGFEVSDTSDELAPLRPEVDTSLRFKHLSTGEAKRLLLWSQLRHVTGPLVLDEPYEHLSREAKAALSVWLQRFSEQSLVVVATNQDVPVRPQDTVLTLDRAAVEVT